jgi:hypothetical protein
VLDLGCAEAVVSLELAKARAMLVHGVELLGDRLRTAEALFQENVPNLGAAFHRVGFDTLRLPVHFMS